MHNGGGLESGIPHTSPLQAAKSMLRRKELAAEGNLVDRIAANRCRIGQRLKKA